MLGLLFQSLTQLGAADLFLVLVLVHCLGAIGPVENFSIMFVSLFTAFDLVGEFDIGLQDFDEFAEDASSHHYNALCELGCHEGVLLIGFSPARTFLSKE